MLDKKQSYRASSLMNERLKQGTKKEIWITTSLLVARKLQEKRRFGTSGPLRFKKNGVLGQADPSASLLQSGNFKIYSFFICLLNEKMTSITKIKAIALTRLNNLE